jgi:hypothetical protein
VTTLAKLDRVQRLAQLAGVVWFDPQREAFDYALTLPDGSRLICLYVPTGAGKSLTSLATMNLWDQNKVLVIAPPSTHDTWVKQGKQLGMTIEVMSHAKFRMKDTKLDRNTAIIADEMHLFGGHKGKGWIKLDRLARGLQAPLILASATPNYNDADRVYCIQHVLDPKSCSGGFLQFLYTHCITEQNPFGVMPNVLGFQKFNSAAEYLAALPGVLYVPDELDYEIEDFPIAEKIPPAFEDFGLDQRRGRIIASLIEERHARVFHSLLTGDGFVAADVQAYVEDWITTAVNSVLIYCDHSTVAEALSNTLALAKIDHALVTGKTSAKAKAQLINDFRMGNVEVLIGTATLATGTDGLDKVCDWLIIVDDTDDDSLRRQLIGRIMPRGGDTDTTLKHVRRLVVQ